MVLLSVGIPSTYKLYNLREKQNSFTVDINSNYIISTKLTCIEIKHISGN